jgi:hypothetical protein
VLAPPGSQDLGAVALAVLRAGLALYVLASFPKRLPFARQPYPTGLARLVDLTFLSAPRSTQILWGAVAAAAGAYALGIGLPAATGVLALAVAGVGALRGSQGGSIHGPQAPGLVLLVQTVAFGRAATIPAVWASAASPAGLAAQRTAVRWSQQALVAVYVSSALTKLLTSRGRWPLHAAYAPLQVAKAAEQAFVRTGDAGWRDRRLALADRLAAHPWGTRLIFSCGLAVELLSPLFLLSPTATVAGGGLLLLLHWAVGLAMGLPFWPHQAMLLLFMANPLLLE